MSMKGHLYMMMAMAGMFGSMPMGGMPSYREPRRHSPSKPLTPEEEAKILEERQAKFLVDLERHNADRKNNFPKFKEFEIHGLSIIAFSLKNATRDMNRLMRENYIAIKEEKDFKCAKCGFECNSLDALGWHVTSECKGKSDVQVPE